MRPWTLNPVDASLDNPMLSMLGKCILNNDVLVPAWRGTPTPDTHRRRLKTKKRCVDTDVQVYERYSYATSWEEYIDGNVVSKSSRRYIVNLLAATAATKTAEQNDSSEDTDEEAWAHMDLKAGNMDVVRCTLDGIAARSADEGAKGLGRYAKTIRLGRSLWQSAPLTSKEAEGIRERNFDDGTFPPQQETKKALERARKLDEARPAPFQGRTEPFASYSVTDYGALLEEWFIKIQAEEEKPTSEQMENC